MTGPTYRVGCAGTRAPSLGQLQPSTHRELTKKRSQKETTRIQTPGVLPHTCSPNSFARMHVPSFINGDPVPRAGSQSEHPSAFSPTPLAGANSGR